MDIFRTFEIFLSAPLSIIHKRNIRIMHVETNIFEKKIPINVDLSCDDINFTVYNSKNVYKLLSNVIYKKKLNDENNKSKIYNKRSVFKIMP